MNDSKMSLTLSAVQDVLVRQVNKVKVKGFGLKNSYLAYFFFFFFFSRFYEKIQSVGKKKKKSSDLSL